MKLTITGSSTALFSTWYLVEEFQLLFDAGDGVISNLLQRSRKAQHVFVSHADRDHMSSLMAFRQMHARPEGFPKIYYPKDARSFEYLKDFSARFAPHSPPTPWYGVDDGQEFAIKPNYIVKSIRNEHIDVPLPVIKSVGYEILEVKRKLKTAFKGLSGLEIKALREKKGNDFITQEQRQSILTYTGDTPVRDYDLWSQANVLIHEATFLEAPAKNKRGSVHSVLEEVIDMVAQSQVQQLILGHFSMRYSKQEIEQAVQQLCQQYQLHIPVFCVLPGVVARDILSTPPTYQPS
ncbi:MAG: MBL fold metallo-hydrolase [Aureispira sp.]